MPRKPRTPPKHSAPPPKAPPNRDAKKSLDEEAEVTALDMAVLNEFIHDTERSDTLRLAALKVKVGREAALLKERIAEKTSGMNIVVNTLTEDGPDGDA